MEELELNEIPDFNGNMDNGGMELLMNSHNNLFNKNKDTDLNELEYELNGLTDDKHNVSFNDDNMDDNFDLGKDVLNSNAGITKTWDGYNKYSNMPNIDDTPIKSKNDNLKDKLKLLKKLENYEKNGIKLTKTYTIESDYGEMKAEDDVISEDINKKNMIKAQGEFLYYGILAIEKLSSLTSAYHSIELDGFSDQIKDNIESYDDIFEQLYYKYKDHASISPELSLIFKVGIAAGLVNVTNKMFNSSQPLNFNNSFQMNPNYSMNFNQNDVINNLSQSNPGFAKFASHVMNNQPPPPPIATKGPNIAPPPRYRPGNNEFAQPQLQTQTRPEMKGPTDISSILSGLKTKNININKNRTESDNASIISNDDVKNIKEDLNLPKRSKRKKPNTTVSLDI